MEFTKMAGAVAKQLFSRNSVLSCRALTFGQFHNTRCLSTSHKLQTDSDTDSKSWLKNFLPVRTLPASKESHSSLLSNKETVYEMQFHAVKPESMEEYLKQFQSFQQLMHDKGTGAKLIGSFTVEIGDQDEAVHIWQYPGGYPVLNNATEIYRKDKDFIDYRLRRNKMLRSRKNQILLPFSFWPEPTARSGSNIYEMRSYTLKPGTMIEWGNNWARGIENRRSNDEAVAGLFTHLGEQYVVHHVWGYTDLQSRKETREQAWSKPGWDECVAYTVPLIRHMQSRILIPTPFSPLQ
ncbi:protein NipSnap-like isoform X1 [Argopecten irradians]|uniref:protein NipSnap-like isoform X1 n=1 Tax=Argopecten irradians TaxID=31199 RepID=UPI00372105DB